MWTEGHGHISHLVHPKTRFLDRLQHAKKGPKNLANTFSDAIAILKKKLPAEFFFTRDKSYLRWQVPLDKSVNLTSQLDKLTCLRRDRGIYSIWGGRSLYCLSFGISQLMEPEACFGIFVRIILGWLSNRSLYQTFPVNPSLLYQAAGTQVNVAKIPFKLKGQFERYF